MEHKKNMFIKGTGGFISHLKGVFVIRSCFHVSRRTFRKNLGRCNARGEEINSSPIKPLKLVDSLNRFRTIKECSAPESLAVLIN